PGHAATGSSSQLGRHALASNCAMQTSNMSSQASTSSALSAAAAQPAYSTTHASSSSCGQPGSSHSGDSQGPGSMQLSNNASQASMSWMVMASATHAACSSK